MTSIIYGANAAAQGLLSSYLLDPFEKKLKHNQLWTILCSESSGEIIILHASPSATHDSTENILLASPPRAALECDKECLLFSFTKITGLLFLLKLWEKKKTLSSLQSFHLLKSYSNDKGNYINYRAWKVVYSFTQGWKWRKWIFEAVWGKNISANWINCL